MNATGADKNYEVIWLIRRLFRAMGNVADDYLQNTGLSAADRAVMEFLYPEKQLSVPEIASLYGVSRQHVQTTVNRLIRRGLVVAEDNPRHKRSSLIRLQRSGRTLFEEIRRKEHSIVERLFDPIAEDDVDTTRNTLENLLSALNGSKKP
jgi:DNA-binding MarR family transcriptional regulator